MSIPRVQRSVHTRIQRCNAQKCQNRLLETAQIRVLQGPRFKALWNAEIRFSEQESVGKCTRFAHARSQSSVKFWKIAENLKSMDPWCSGKTDLRLESGDVDGQTGHVPCASWGGFLNRLVNLSLERSISCLLWFFWLPEKENDHVVKADTTQWKQTLLLRKSSDQISEGPDAFWTKIDQICV